MSDTPQQQSMTIDEGTVRMIVAYLKAYHAKEASSGQNDGSNDTDDMHDDLEMNRGETDVADLEGTYASLDKDQRYDLAALCLLGMEEVSTLAEGREMAAGAGQPGMTEFLEMPLSPSYIAEGLALAGYPSGEDGPTREPSDDGHAA